MCLGKKKNYILEMICPADGCAGNLQGILPRLRGVVLQVRRSLCLCHSLVCKCVVSMTADDRKHWTEEDVLVTCGRHHCHVPTRSLSTTVSHYNLAGFLAFLLYWPNSQTMASPHV